MDEPEPRTLDLEQRAAYAIAALVPAGLAAGLITTLAGTPVGVWWVLTGLLTVVVYRFSVRQWPEG